MSFQLPRQYWKSSTAHVMHRHVLKLTVKEDDDDDDDDKGGKDDDDEEDDEDSDDDPKEAYDETEDAPPIKAEHFDKPPASEATQDDD